MYSSYVVCAVIVQISGHVGSAIFFSPLFQRNMDCNLMVADFNRQPCVICLFCDEKETGLGFHSYTCLSKQKCCGIVSNH